MALFGRNRKDEVPSLVIISFGGREGLLPKFAYPLGAGEETIGRDEQCSIQVLDPKISRRQLVVRRQESRYVAEDLGSANGTYVNGRKLTEPTPLSEGDIIEIGNSRLVFTSKRFKSQDAAFLNFKREGERYRGTMQVDMPER